MLLTRSPLIRPASWPSPFDLHVLSTPPAFVLSQNQTLRQCQTPPNPRRDQATDTTKNNTDLASITEPIHPRGERQAPINTKAHHDTTSQQTTWHRLLGTLLSSQRTDAHPSWPFDPFGGNRSNLAVRLPLVNFAALVGAGRGEATDAGQSGCLGRA